MFFFILILYTFVCNKSSVLHKFIKIFLLTPP
nr:MAG TPA: hypothetical protein [Caudoviricetes sp.]